jgi:hypothetical protein
MQFNIIPLRCEKCGGEWPLALPGLRPHESIESDIYELPLSPSLIKEGEAVKPRGRSKKEVSFRGRFGGVPYPFLTSPKPAVGDHKGRPYLITNVWGTNREFGYCSPFQRG